MVELIPKLSPPQVQDWFTKLPKEDFTGRVLLIISDSTPQPSLPLLFDALFREIRPVCGHFDVLVALGTNDPMSDVQISNLLGISQHERGRLFYQTQFFNHDWDRDDRLTLIGTLNSEKSAGISNGRLSCEVPVRINSRINDYDLLLVLSPVVPQKIVGFSGGNACFFPGLAGPESLEFLDRIGSDTSKVETLGRKDTPVRLAIDAFSAMIPRTRRAMTFVAGSDGSLCGLFYDTPEASWSAAADLAARL